MGINLVEIRKAIEASIEQWNSDIIDRFKAGDSIYELENLDGGGFTYFKPYWKSDNEPVKCYYDSCALFAVVKVCIFCPLRVIDHSLECNAPLSPWQRFMEDPCLETAETMVGTLKGILNPNSLSIIDKALRRKFMPIYRQSTFERWPFFDRSVQAIITSLPCWSLRRKGAGNDE